MLGTEVIEAHLAKCISDVTVGAVAAAEVKSEMGLLTDLALDSLDFATVMLMTEQWLGVSVPEAKVDWRQVRTVRDLAELLAGLQDAADT